MVSARSLQCKWILGETTDLHCPGLSLEMLAVLRNFFKENSGLVGVGRGEWLFTQDACIPGMLGKPTYLVLGHGKIRLHKWRYMYVPAALRGVVQVLTLISFIPQSTSTFLGECD